MPAAVIITDLTIGLASFIAALAPWPEDHPETPKHRVIWDLITFGIGTGLIVKHFVEVYGG